MISFQKSTFICLDIPNLMAEKIRKIRLDLDSQIAWKPVVITLAGSSGCGHISDEQDIFEANKILTNLSHGQLSIRLKFSRINFFPETDIYFFEFEDDSELIDIHNEIKNCGIKFLNNEFPFKAHCTIHFKGRMNSIKKDNILKTKIPDEYFEIDTISLISDYNHLTRFQLKGNQKHHLTGA